MKNFFWTQNLKRFGYELWGDKNGKLIGDL